MSSSNNQTVKEVAMIKDSEAYKYFNQTEVKFIKTHKRERSLYITETSNYEVVTCSGMKRKRVS